MPSPELTDREKREKFVGALLASILDADLEALADEPDSEPVRLMRTLFRERLTMVNAAALWNLHRLTRRYEHTAGAFVECGVALGGTLAFIAAFAGGERTVWGFDSFAGLPALATEDGDSGKEFVGVRYAGPDGRAAVAATFATVGVPMTRVRIVQGWFNETLPQYVAEVGPIAILRLDGDLYEATRDALDTLYDCVVPGGAVVIDDYGTFLGCRRAVDEFRSRRGITSPLVESEPGGEVTWLV